MLSSKDEEGRQGGREGGRGTPYLDQQRRLGKVEVGLPTIQGDLEPVQFIEVVLQGGGNVLLPSLPPSLSHT